MKRFAIFVSLLSFSLVSAADFETDKLGNWHQWRGPHATGTAPQGDPPTEWSESKNIQWKVQVPGNGLSTPIVWNDRVYLVTAEKTDKVDPKLPPADKQGRRPFGITFANHFHRFVVLSLSRKTGKVVWRKVALEAAPFQGHHPDNNFASPSPTTDGKRLYVWLGSQGFYCYDLDGNLLWKRDLGPAKTRLSFGEGASPVVHKDRVVVIRDTEDQSYVMCLAAATGKTIWKKERDESSAWATPVVVKAGGTTQLVTNAKNRVRSYDLTTGELLWECGGQVSNVTPSPVVMGGMVFCASGYRGSSLQALPLDQKGDFTDSDKILWQLKRGTPYVPSLLLFKGTLYFNRSNEAMISAVDAKSGEVIFDRSRLSGMRRIYASPVAAKDRVYFVGRRGKTVVLQHGSGKEVRVLATNKLDDRIDASPAIVGKQIFLRGRRHLYCVSKK